MISFSPIFVASSHPFHQEILVPSCCDEPSITSTTPGIRLYAMVIVSHLYKAITICHEYYYSSS